MPVAGVPPVTLVGLTLNEESVAGGGAVADGVTVRSANCVTPPPVTEILTTVVADTAAGRIMMKPLVLPAGTTTPFDSVGSTAPLLLVTLSTWSKPAAVAMVTVPLTEPCPPTVAAGESVRDVGAGPGTTVTCDCTVAPFHVADARDPRADHAAQDVEAHRVADMQAGALGDLPLDRHLGLRRRTLPERALDDALVRLEMIAIRDGELAAERHPARAHVFHAVEHRLAAGHADDAGPYHRNQLKLAGAVGFVAEKRADALDLPLLHVEEEHVR